MRLGVLTDHRIVAVIDGGSAVDVSAVLPGATVSERLGAYLEHADEVRDLAQRAEADRMPLPGLKFIAPSPSPRTVLAAPVNFARHKGELGDRSPDRGALDARQMGLIVLAASSVVGPDATIELPDLRGREFHFEGEVAIVIGRPARGVSRVDALAHVLGYTGLLDITMRIGPEGQEDRSMRKSFHTFTPIGPYIRTADGVADPAALSLELSLNGQVRQRGTLADLIVDVPDLVVRAAQMVPLVPGDIIATGTPAGVGPIVPGDRLSLSVSGLGELVMHVTRRSW